LRIVKKVPFDSLKIASKGREARTSHCGNWFVLEAKSCKMDVDSDVHIPHLFPRIALAAEITVSEMIPR